MGNSALLQIAIPEATRTEISNVFLDLARETTKIAIDDLKVKDWLTKNELCTYLSVSPPTIDKFIQLGCPVSRVERVVRFNVQSVNQWLLNQK